MSTLTAEAVEVREIFVRAVADHYSLELYETPSAVWCERMPGLVYMAHRAPASPIGAAS